MPDNTPSRLPDTVVRVSRCPICKYSLKDLDEQLPCPECGSPIDRDLITSPKMQDAIAATKTWCTLGAIGWTLTGFGIWIVGMASFAFARTYGGLLPGPYDELSVWLRTSSAIAPITLCIAWHIGAKRNIYRSALQRSGGKPKTPKRVILVCLPGIAMGLFGCGLFMLLISS